MMLISLALTLAQTPKVAHVEIPLRRKAAYFMRVTWPTLAGGKDLEGNAQPSLFPKSFFDDVKAKADAKANRLVLDGPSDKLEKIKQVVALFDVVPRKVNISVTSSLAEEGVTYDSQATIDNDTTWKSAWDELKESTAIRPRVNDDGTITLKVDLDGFGQRSKVVVRLRNNEAVNLTFEPSGHVDMAFGHPRPDEQGKGLLVRIQPRTLDR